MLAITPGDCAAAQLRGAGLATDVLPWRDLLHEGPVPAGPDGVELGRIRADYILAVGWADPASTRAQFAARDADLAEAAAKPVEIVLWFDHNLVNRLALLQVADRLAELRGPGLPDVTLAEPTGFGDADAGQLAELAESRAALDTEQVVCARGAWAAFRSADPTVLLPYTSDGPVAGLGPALLRHLDQFPHPGDGLAGTERRALRAISDGAHDFAGVYRAVTAEDTPAWLGDTVLRSHLARLAAGRQPLLLDDSTDGFRLTDAGRAVLAGRADHVALNGIDHWLGGVHLTGSAPWGFDPDTRQLSR